MKLYKRKDLTELHVLCPNSGAWKKLIATLLKSQLLYISSFVITNRILINIPLFSHYLLYPRKPEFSFWKLKKVNHKNDIQKKNNDIQQTRKSWWVYLLRNLFISMWRESRSVMSNFLQPHGLCSLWNSPGQNTGVGSLSFLQGIFPTQGSNPGLPHYRQILFTSWATSNACYQIQTAAPISFHFLPQKGTV